MSSLSNNQKTYTERILAGLADACLTSFYLKDGDFTEIKPEYLLTTLVAKQFAFQDSGLLVKLEEPTGEFARSCVKELKSSWQFSKEHDVSRKGKIDIAVYFSKTEDGYMCRRKSYFPIELKGINTDKGEYLKDIERNIEYFGIQDDNTGGSILNHAFNASIEEAEKILYSEDLEKFIKKIEKKYKRWLKKHKQEFEASELKYKITVSPVMDNLYSKEDKFDLSEGLTEQDYIQDWYLYVGVVVEIFRKKRVNNFLRKLNQYLNEL